MKELVEKYGQDLIPFKVGSTVEALVVGTNRNRISVNVNDFCVGIVPEKEFSAEGLEVKPGDKILASVIDLENVDGNLILSLKRADKERVWQNLKEKMNSGESVKVKVTEANRGGLLVQYGSVEGFLPLSKLPNNFYSQSARGDSAMMIQDLRKLINKVLDVKIINVDQQNNKLIFSEKDVSQANRKQMIKDQFKVGQVVDGEVTGIVPFGLFVNIGEFEGLVHISEIAWERVGDLHKHYRTGDKVKAEIIDLENGKISLSIKRLMPDPWLNKSEKYKVGEEFKGKVIRITPFGILVELDQDVHGLVNIKDLPRTDKAEKSKIKEETLAVGKDYDFKIQSFDANFHKISLSPVNSNGKNSKSKIKVKKDTKKEK